MQTPFSIPARMKAAVYRGVNQIQIEELPVPEIAAGELLVRVGVCGVCPTDIKKIQHGTVPPPRVFGHETAGTIVRAGRLVKHFREGQRVGLHHHVPCLECHACRHRAFAQCPVYKKTGITAGFEPAGGGYAEFVRIMPFVLPGVVPIPDGNTLLQGAMLEPVNTVLKGIKLLQILEGDTVLVAGQGPIGLMFTKLLKLRGAQVIATDLLEERRRLSRTFGADHSMDPAHPDFESQVGDLTAGRGLDAAIIAVPVDAAVRQAQRLLRGGGQVLLFAHTRRGAETSMDLADVCVDEKQLLGSYSSDFTLQDEAAELVFSGKLDVAKLVTHQFPLDRAAEAIQLASKPAPGALKIVVSQENQH
jgi:L-iditol 2-dehydrogenase